MFYNSTSQLQKKFYWAGNIIPIHSSESIYHIVIFVSKPPSEVNSTEIESILWAQILITYYQNHRNLRCSESHCFVFVNMTEASLSRFCLASPITKKNWLYYVVVKSPLNNGPSTVSVSAAEKPQKNQSILANNPFLAMIKISLRK